VKEIVILGGPNGAVKTTAARRLLPKFSQIQEFLNADEFARAICPGDVESVSFAAGRKMLARMQELIADGMSFGLESTLAGRSYVPLLKACKQSGWRITILFLWLPSPNDAIERVARRVIEGGHGISPEIIQRRYFTGQANLLRLYLPLADELQVYDNSVKRVLIASRREGGVIHLWDVKRWSKLKRAARCDP
jgi:predicted ABC-type ATPase